ncbi:CspA family cold shock protein [Siphonobacter sp. SORGH_AS 1065]|nr:CspA family cold shock protein [Siphonobacter sp. SORGH_AS_1065]
MLTPDVQEIFVLFIFLFTMQTGTVKFFNETKGFGFILDDASGQDIFVHATGLSSATIRQDDRVSFDTIEGKRGLNAVNVKKI